jgi:hypothetical protein
MKRSGSPCLNTAGRVPQVCSGGQVLAITCERRFAYSRSPNLKCPVAPIAVIHAGRICRPQGAAIRTQKGTNHRLKNALPLVHPLLTESRKRL